MVFDIVNNLLLYVEPQQKVCQIKPRLSVLRYHVAFLEIGFAILRRKRFPTY